MNNCSPKIGRMAAAAVSLVVAVVLTYGFEAQAQEEEQQDDFIADIEISIPLEINEQNPVSFGIVGRPADSSSTITLDWNNGNLIVDGEQIVAEDGEAGQYHVRGPSGAEIEVVAVLEDFDDVTGLSVEETHIEGESNTTVVEVTGNQGGGDSNPTGPPMGVGGVITLEPGVEPGFHQTDLVITARYE